MRVRDMFQYMCPICVACLALSCFPLVMLVLITLALLVTGTWVPLMWVSGVTVLDGGLVFLVAYSEARSHWKKRERYGTN